MLTRVVPQRVTKACRMDDLLICLSAANFCFSPAWGLFQSFPATALAFYQKEPPSPVLLIATVVNVLLVGLILWSGAIFVRNLQSVAVKRVAKALFLLWLIIPLNAAREALVDDKSLPPSLGAIGFAVLGGVLAGCAVWTAWRREKQPFFPVARTVLLVFAPLLPILIARTTWINVELHRVSAGANARPAASNGGHRAGARVVVLLFDELDQGTVFEHRPPGLQLPELDAFQRVSIHATAATSPGTETLRSVPSLLTGKVIADAVSAGGDELLVTLGGTKQRVPVSSLPTVFSRARERHKTSAVVGFHIPYCKLFGRDLEECWWTPFLGLTRVRIRQEAARNAGLLAAMRSQDDRVLTLVPLLGPRLTAYRRDGFQELALVRDSQNRNYAEITRRAKLAAANPALDLVFVHWPVPHLPGIRLRSPGGYTWQDYIDNLPLADRGLGEVRRAMQAANCWESSSVLVTSDHCLRWEGRRNNLPVPFLLKMPGQIQGVQYRAALNTVLFHDLVIALLEERLHGADDAVRWLDGHPP